MKMNQIDRDSFYIMRQGDGLIASLGFMASKEYYKKEYNAA